MSKIGIDLSANRCHVVRLQGGGRFPWSRAEWAQGTVESVDTLPYGWSDPGALTSQLERVLPRRRQQATVVLWGVRNLQQVLSFPPAKPSELDALARRELSREIARLETTQVTSGLTVIGDRPGRDGAPKREVSFVAASGSEIRTRIQPLVRAGLVVERVVTPALALASLARLQPHTEPGASSAYVAIGEAASVLAIVKDGVLVFSREFVLGYQPEPSRTLGAEELAERLAGELRRSFAYYKQSSRQEVTRIFIGGDMPNLRSLTGPLMSRLEIEVETLDTGDGLDALGSHSAASSLAWAAATDPTSSIDLMPGEIVTEQAVAGLARPLVGGLVTAAVIALLVYLGVDLFARSDGRTVDELETRVAMIEPEAFAIQQERNELAVLRARGAALEAFSTQGPRLARALEDLAAGTAPEVTLGSLNVAANGAHWDATLAGSAVSPNVARTQAAVNQLLRAIEESPYMSAPGAPNQRAMAGQPLTVDPLTGRPLLVPEPERRPVIPPVDLRLGVARNPLDDLDDNEDRLVHVHRPDGPPVTMTEAELERSRRSRTAGPVESAAVVPVPTFEGSGIEFRVNFDIQR